MSSMSSDAPIVDGDQTPNTALQPSSRAAGLALFECWLARGSRIGTHKVRAMLKGAKVLGFVTQDPLRVEHFLLNTLPPVQTLSVEKVRKLQALGVPLFHGNCDHDVAELRWLLSTLPRERDYDRTPAHPSRVWIPGRYEPSPEAGPVISHKGQHGPDCGACSWSREAQAEIEA